MRRIAAIVFLVSVSGHGLQIPVASAQSGSRTLDAHMESVREKFTTRRDAALQTRLVMDKKQAKVFWSLKNKFDAESTMLNRASVELVQDFTARYDRLTPEASAEIAHRFFDLERQRLALQQEYFELISEKVSPVVAVQFIQLHRRYELEIHRMTYAPLAE